MINLQGYTLSNVIGICANTQDCHMCRFCDYDTEDCIFNSIPSNWLENAEPTHNKPIKTERDEGPKEEAPNDAVSHPSHYCVGDIEVIDYIRDKLSPDEFIGYCTGNVLKYVSRWRFKGGVEDLEKGSVYLNWAIEAARKHINNWHEF